MNAAQAVAHYVARDIREFLEDVDCWGNSPPRDKHRSAAAVVARDAKVKESDVRREARVLMRDLYRAAGVRACTSCGCTDAEGCPQGCFWAGPELCSSCAPRPRRKAAR